MTAQTLVIQRLYLIHPLLMCNEAKAFHRMVEDVLFDWTIKGITASLMTPL
jgi:hypothetical protein